MHLYFQDSAFNLLVGVVLLWDLKFKYYVESIHAFALVYRSFIKCLIIY